MKLERRPRSLDARNRQQGRVAKLCSGILLAFACLSFAAKAPLLGDEGFVASKEVKELPKETMQKEEEGDPYAFFVPAVVFFLYLGFGTIYSTEYFMPMGDVGGKVAVAFGVLFVLLVVGVALKEVMD